MSQHAGGIAALRPQGALSTMPLVHQPAVAVPFLPGMAPDAAVGSRDEDLAAKLAARRQWEEATRASIAAAAAATPKSSARPEGGAELPDLSIESAYGAGGETPTSVVAGGKDAQKRTGVMLGGKLSIESAYGAAETPAEREGGVSGNLPSPLVLLPSKGPRFMF